MLDIDNQKPHPELRAALRTVLAAPIAFSPAAGL
jgi:hypothetical protein